MLTLMSSAARAQLACLLEATARKPGNVHRFADFADTSYLDFCASSLVVGKHLCSEQIRDRGVGAVIEQAVRDTRNLVGCNTNLGLVLLLVPLAAVPSGAGLRPGVTTVLESLTVADARAVYSAIRQAHPGGLGTSPAQDVSDEPTVTLRHAMALAADRDAIARQYVSDYADVFDLGLPAIRRHLEAGRSLERAIVACHLVLMAERPDTLIARKCGVDVAVESAGRASAVLASGWPESAAGRTAIATLDHWLRAEQNRRNPGATADLVAAVLYAALYDGTIALPIDTIRSFDAFDPALRVLHPDP
jgi:triphosphoribosyl-dephospho-CoA synthase